MKIKYTEGEKHWLSTKEKVRIEKNKGLKTCLSDFTKKGEEND